MFCKTCPQSCMALIALLHGAMLHSQGQAGLQTPDCETDDGLSFTLGAAAGLFLRDAHGITDNAHSMLLLDAPCPFSICDPALRSSHDHSSPTNAAAGLFSPDTRRFFQGVKKASQAMAVKQAQRLEAEASGSSIRRAQEEADRCVRSQLLHTCTAKPAAACSSSGTQFSAVVNSVGAGCRRCVSSCRFSRLAVRPGSKGDAQVSRPALPLSSLPGLRGSRDSCRQLIKTALR